MQQELEKPLGRVGGAKGQRANVMQLQLTIAITTRRVMPRYGTTRHDTKATTTITTTPT